MEGGHQLKMKRPIEKESSTSTVKLFTVSTIQKVSRKFCFEIALPTGSHNPVDHCVAAWYIVLQQAKSDRTDIAFMYCFRSLYALEIIKPGCNRVHGHSLSNQQ